MFPFTALWNAGSSAKAPETPADSEGGSQGPQEGRWLRFLQVNGNGDITGMYQQDIPTLCKQKPPHVSSGTKKKKNEFLKAKMIQWLC